MIATRETHGPAIAVSKGLDRDRAVDESGNQVAVFGRIGARPLSLDGMKRLYMRDGEVWTVTDEPENDPQPWTYEPPEDDQPRGRGRRRGRGGAR